MTSATPPLRLRRQKSQVPSQPYRNRAHDLVDLQLLDQEETIDMAEVAAIAIRLFTARRTHAWPPTVVAYDGWDTIYAAAAEGLDVLDNPPQADLSEPTARLQNW